MVKLKESRKKYFEAAAVVLSVLSLCLSIWAIVRSTNRAFYIRKIKEIGWELEKERYPTWFLHTFIEANGTKITITEVKNLASFLHYAEKFGAEKIYYDTRERLFFCFTPINNNVLKLYY